MKDRTYSSLVLDMLPWCEVIAKGFVRKHYYNKENEYGDYVNSAVVGLYDAYRNYDEKKGQVQPYCFRYMYLEMNRILIHSNAYQSRKLSMAHSGYAMDEYLSLNYPDSSIYSSIDGSVQRSYEFSDLIAAQNLIVSLCVDRKKVMVDHYFRDIKIKDIASSMGRDPSRISQIHQLAISELKNKASGKDKNG
ncbi:RNA polymerase sigma factor FliA [Grimontia celer]|uniref:RNA polymerase sigma factor FliA n=1 Tax=Grimontia celer TaxID=1796497 RepID=A0A128F818_9GAMM|nr:sigma-70 family RNA polymerase sigma factor [Grimontia celer]CZF82630.1 RNA polymerase sigma factor FliA [Grimontia celer]